MTRREIMEIVREEEQKFGSVVRRIIDENDDKLEIISVFGKYVPTYVIFHICKNKNEYELISIQIL